MVRLEAAKIGSEKPTFIFQFHYGTIRSLQDFGDWFLGDLDFNSTMVRLEVEIIYLPL